jgi:hypothetical protein
MQIGTFGHQQGNRLVVPHGCRHVESGRSIIPQKHIEGGECGDAWIYPNHTPQITPPEQRHKPHKGRPSSSLIVSSQRDRGYGTRSLMRLVSAPARRRSQYPGGFQIPRLCPTTRETDRGNMRPGAACGETQQKTDAGIKREKRAERTPQQGAGRLHQTAGVRRVSVPMS